MREKIYSNSEVETENIAYSLASKTQPGDIIALNGEMGAGKTAFTRGFVKLLAPSARVTSPTFALVNQYEMGAGGSVFHFDMYRIEGEEALLSIGFYDYLDRGDILIIEWFENIRDFFDEHTVEIDIVKTSDTSREIIFERVKEI